LEIITFDAGFCLLSRSLMDRTLKGSNLPLEDPKAMMLGLQQMPGSQIKSYNLKAIILYGYR
jgi:hypothetical protein